MSVVLIAEVIAIACASAAGMSAANRACENGPHARPCQSRVKTASNQMTAPPHRGAQKTHH